MSVSSVPVEADQAQQLRGVLHRLGATPYTEFTILSDGADGPRSLGETASVGTTCHVLDWSTWRCASSLLAAQSRAATGRRTPSAK